MIKALRTVSAQDTVMAALADVHAQRAVGYDGTMTGVGSAPKNPLVEKESQVSRLKPGQLPGQQALQVSSWSVEDVAKWLQTLSLGQYSEAFIDSAVDGEFLYDLTDDDLKNTLGIEHRLHRKKILNCVNRLKMAEAQNESRLGVLQHTLFSSDAVSFFSLNISIHTHSNQHSFPFFSNRVAETRQAEEEVVEERLLQDQAVLTSTTLLTKVLM
jgi:hypothetical protein